MLDQARAGTLPGMTRTGVTFAEAREESLDAARRVRGRAIVARAALESPPARGACAGTSAQATVEFAIG